MGREVSTPGIPAGQDFGRFRSGRRNHGRPEADEDGVRVELGGHARRGVEVRDGVR